MWRKFVDLLPEAERNDPIPAYGARLENPDRRINIPAARAWGAYEQALSELKSAATKLPDTLHDAKAAKAEQSPRTPYVEWHYIKQNCFLEPDQLVRDAARLKQIPGIIVQGRYDLLCPPVSARRIADAWGNAEVRMIADAGHSASEPSLRAALVEAIDEMGRRLAGS